MYAMESQRGERLKDEGVVRIPGLVDGYRKTKPERVRWPWQGPCGGWVGGHTITHLRQAAEGCQRVVETEQMASKIHLMGQCI